MRNLLSAACKFITELGFPRSPKWRALRNAHIVKEPWCRKCGGTENLEVHHVDPFHIDPSKELDPSNFLTLCEKIGIECHLKHGHCGNWKWFNPQVRASLSPMPGVPAHDYQNEIDSSITPIKS